MRAFYFLLRLRCHFSLVYFLSLLDRPFFQPCRYAQSFYYAANVGYSIGFGALSETSDVSRIFSVVLIGAGASAIGGALGFFVAGALEDNDSYSGEASHLDWTADQV